jgi:integrase
MSVFKVGDRYAFAIRIPTSQGPQTQLKRGGFKLKKNAETTVRHIDELLAVPKIKDDRTRAKIGDDIVSSTRRGGRLPDVEEVRRRYGARLDPTAKSPTTGDFLEQWVTGRRKIKDTTRVAHRYCMRAYLVPHIGDIPLDVLSADHVEDLRDALEARGTLSPASIHGIAAVLRAALNTAIKRQLIAVNPVTQVEWPTVPHKEATYLKPDEVVRLLEAVADDRDGIVFRVALLGGMRRGELCALRWEDVDWESGELDVRKQFVWHEGVWKLTDTKTSNVRHVSLDPDTVTALRRHQKTQLAERLAAGSAWQEGNFVFARPDGTHLNPKGISYRFKQVAEQVGVEQKIRGLHAARHTSATLDLLAGTDVKVISRNLGHRRTQTTQETYQHVLRDMQTEAAEARAALLRLPTIREAGS